MPALRGTRAPEGASLPRPGGQATYREVALWPGIAWGRDARCECSWAYRYGAMRVKVRSGACTVHIGGRKPEAPPVPALVPEYELPPPAASPDAVLLAACQSGTVTRELYEESVAAWRAGHEAAVTAALLTPQIAGLAELLLGYSQRPVPVLCPCGRGYDRADSDGSLRCGVCRRRQYREATARYRARAKARQRERGRPCAADLPVV